MKLTDDLIRLKAEGVDLQVEIKVINPVAYGFAPFRQYTFIHAGRLCVGIVDGRKNADMFLEGFKAAAKYVFKRG